MLNMVEKGKISRGASKSSVERNSRANAKQGLKTANLEPDYCIEQIARDRENPGVENNDMRAV